MAKGEINLIGISSQKEETRLYTAEVVSKFTEYPIARPDEVIYDFMNRLLGINVNPDSPAEMKTFLGREWSYVREEKFNENGVITIRINDLFDTSPASREEQLLDGYTFNYTIEVNDKEDIVYSLKQLLWHIESTNPNAFTGKSAKLLT